MRKLSKKQKLEFARNAIHNAKNNPKIKAALNKFGYDDEKLKEGEALYLKANSLELQNMKEQGNKLKASADITLARAALNELYATHLKLGRIIFKNEPGWITELGLHGARSSSNPVFASQASAFYSNTIANAEVVEKFGKYGVKKAELQEGKKRLEGLQKCISEHKNHKGGAETATLEQKKAINEMTEWFMEFFAISRIALSDSPQQLESLGIFVRS